MPGAVFLATDEAIGQAAHVIFPGRIVDHGQDQFGGVHIPVLHEPPPVVVFFGAENHFGALVADARAQHLGGFAHAFAAFGHVLHALEDVQPVNDGVCGPLVGCDGDALEHARLRFAVTRQGFDGGEFAHIEVFACAPGAPDIAFELAFDEGDQAAFHGGAHFIIERKGRVQAGRFVRGRQQVGRQCVAACVGVAVARREVVGQAVAVQVAWNLRGHGLPEFAVAQAHRLAGFLF